MRSVGAVLSLFWIAFVGFGSWYGITLGSTSFDWLVRLVSVPPDKVPNTAALDGFGLYWQLIDPVPLFAMMFVPVAAVALLLAIGRRLAGRGGALGS